MLAALFATATATAAAESSGTWTAVLAAGVVINLFIGLGVLVRMLSGKGSERQIEPTQLAGIQTELTHQTSTLNDINREMGEAKRSIEAVDGKITLVAAAQIRESENAFKRINSISIESATTARVLEGHLNDHRAQRA